MSQLVMCAVHVRALHLLGVKSHRLMRLVGLWFAMFSMAIFVGGMIVQVLAADADADAESALKGATAVQKAVMSVRPKIKAGVWYVKRHLVD